MGVGVGGGHGVTDAHMQVYTLLKNTPYKKS